MKKQNRLVNKIKNISSTISLEEYYERYVFTCLSILILFIGLYVYLTINIVVMAISSKDLGFEIKVAQSEITEKETVYMALEEKVDMEKAKDLGFKNFDTSVFASQNKESRLTFAN